MKTSIISLLSGSLCFLLWAGCATAAVRQKTFTDFNLQKETLENIALMVASESDNEEERACENGKILSTQVTQIKTPGKRRGDYPLAWSEVWSVHNCGTVVGAEINYRRIEGGATMFAVKINQP